MYWYIEYDGSIHESTLPSLKAFSLSLFKGLVHTAETLTYDPLCLGGLEVQELRRLSANGVPWGLRVPGKMACVHPLCTQAFWCWWAVRPFHEIYKK